MEFITGTLMEFRECLKVTYSRRSISMTKVHG